MNETEARAHIRLWIAELRDPAHSQGQGQLVSPMEPDQPGAVARAFCCLGLACETAIKAGLALEFVTWGYRCIDGVGPLYTVTTTLPLTVVEWLLGPARGTTPDSDAEEYPLAQVFCNGGAVATLTAIDANDSLTWTFEEIAQVLEWQLNGQAEPPEHLNVWAHEGIRTAGYGAGDLSKMSVERPFDLGSDPE